MTQAELESVLFMRGEMQEVEADLATLRMTADSVKPQIDGLPRSHRIIAQVEELTLKIIQQEERLKMYKAALSVLKVGLLEKIMSLGAPAAQQTVIIMRYVECRSYKDIAFHTQFPLRHVYRLCEKFKIGHLTALGNL